MASKTRPDQILGPVRANAGFEAMYRLRLIGLVDAMHADVARAIQDLYRADEAEIAADAPPAKSLSRLMRRMTVKWLARFDEAAPVLARWFQQGAASRSDAALKQILLRSGYAVPFKLTLAMRDIATAAVEQNVSLIKSIAQQYLTEVEGMVMRSVATGRDAFTLSHELQQRFSVTRNRAAFIARDQNNKATSQLTRARQLDIGIEHGVWKHSLGGNHPRASHLKADGTVFDLRRGCFIEGEWIFPGEKPNCRCYWTPVIPGLALPVAA
jgi:SPP1 gp7 family putative phage head morphogenesis protein